MTTTDGQVESCCEALESLQKVGFCIVCSFVPLCHV